VSERVDVLTRLLKRDGHSKVNARVASMRRLRGLQRGVRLRVECGGDGSVEANFVPFEGGAQAEDAGVGGQRGANVDE